MNLRVGIARRGVVNLAHELPEVVGISRVESFLGSYD